jgi:hypothetical protein
MIENGLNGRHEMSYLLSLFNNSQENARIEARQNNHLIASIEQHNAHDAGDRYMNIIKGAGPNV